MAKTVKETILEQLETEPEGQRRELLKLQLIRIRWNETTPKDPAPVTIQHRAPSWRAMGR